MTAQTGAADWRSDIDALRAIAVGLVLLYHFGIGPFPGGFIGVDIFFVISGYLITGILARQLDAGRFGFADFYARRIRRILPALCMVVLATLAAATAILLPSDFRRFALSALAALFSVSNIFYWRGSGYFGPAPQLEPLLHSWSLGVEEQFYLVLPLLMWGAVRLLPAARRHLWLFLLFASIALASLILAEFAVRSGKAGPAFFLMPTRMWELLAGSLLALGIIPPPARRAIASAAAILGLAMILVAATRFHSAMAFPGLSAALPVGGTALMIWAGGRDHLLIRPLTVRPMLFTGLISYSLYLWHWPLLALSRYVHVDPLLWHQRLGLLALSVLLAWAGWRWVEQPLRHGANRTRLVIGGFLATAAIVVAALLLVPRADRFSPEVVRMNASAGSMWRCGVSEYLPLGQYYGCPLNLPDRAPASATLVLWGDSHAQMYVPAVLPALEQAGTTGLLVPQNGCAPVGGSNRGPVCARIGRANLDAILALPKVKTVVLGLYWQNYLSGLTDQSGRVDGRTLFQELEATIASLRARGITVMLIGPTAVPGYDVASEWSRAMAFGREIDRPRALDRAAFDQQTPGVADFLRRMETAHGVIVIDMAERLCSAQSCPFIVDGRALHGDGNHLSADSARTLTPLFAAVLQPADQAATAG